MTQNKLFAVYLGGRAPKGNTELHDVVFVTGRAMTDEVSRMRPNNSYYLIPKAVVEDYVARKAVDNTLTRDPHGLVYPE
jgi:hypothetical protein